MAQLNGWRFFLTMMKVIFFEKKNMLCTVKIVIPSAMMLITMYWVGRVICLLVDIIPTYCKYIWYYCQHKEWNFLNILCKKSTEILLLNNFRWNYNVTDQGVLHVYFSKYGTIRLKQDVTFYWYELMSKYKLSKIVLEKGQILQIRIFIYF